MLFVYFVNIYLQNKIEGVKYIYVQIFRKNRFK